MRSFSRFYGSVGRVAPAGRSRFRRRARRPGAGCGAHPTILRGGSMPRYIRRGFPSCIGPTSPHASGADSGAHCCGARPCARLSGWTGDDSRPPTSKVAGSSPVALCSPRHASGVHSDRLLREARIATRRLRVCSHGFLRTGPARSPCAWPKSWPRTSCFRMVQRCGPSSTSWGSLVRAQYRPSRFNREKPAGYDSRAMLHVWFCSLNASSQPPFARR
jgi:hypothetical protein